MDGFCPIGPSILTADKIADPHKLAISCRVNGQIKQTSNTHQLIHGVYGCIAFLSKYSKEKSIFFRHLVHFSWIDRFCTLLPGDIVLTGTPPGCGGFTKPPQFLKVILVHFRVTNVCYSLFCFLPRQTLKKGDVVECEVEQLGIIRNQIV